jgi:hypothetical protein
MRLLDTVMVAFPVAIFLQHHLLAKRGDGSIMKRI